MLMCFDLILKTEVFYGRIDLVSVGGGEVERMREKQCVCVLREGSVIVNQNDCIGLIWDGITVLEKAGKRKRWSVCLQV